MTIFTASTSKHIMAELGLVVSMASHWTQLLFPMSECTMATAKAVTVAFPVVAKLSLVLSPVVMWHLLSLELAMAVHLLRRIRILLHQPSSH